MKTKTQGVLSLFLLTTLLTSLPLSADTKIPLKVVDEKGVAIDKAEAQILFFGNDSPWSPVGKEFTVFERSFGEISGGQPLTLQVRAPGRPSAFVSVSPKEITNFRNIVLDSGKKISVVSQRQGKPVTDIQPILATTETLQNELFQGFPGIPLRTNAFFPPTRESNGTQFLVNQNIESVYLYYNQPGSLRGHLSGPHSIKGNTSTITDNLPEPAQVDIRFAPTEPGMEVTLSFVKFVFVSQGEGKQMGYAVSLGQHKTKGGKIDLQLSDLSPGRYQLEVRERGGDPLGQGPLIDKKELNLVSGKNASPALETTSLKSRLKGTGSGIVSLKLLSGKPAANTKYVLQYARDYPPVELESGSFNEKGEVTFKILPDPKDFPSLSLKVGEEDLDLPLQELKDKGRLDLQLPPTVGDLAPDLELQEAFSGKTVKLSDYKGKVIFLDFWATWCGPCQAPMAENNEILSRRKTDWKGKAEVLAISIDDKVETLTSHVSKKSWKEVTHLWAKAGTPGWKSTAAQTYGIRGVPTCLLVDANGKIIWRGHPAGFRLEERIDGLLKAN